MPWRLVDGIDKLIIMCLPTCCALCSAAAAAQQEPDCCLDVTRDKLFELCTLYLNSDKSRDARDLSMIMYQLFTVSRGDDTRPRRFKELRERLTSSVGALQRTQRGHLCVQLPRKSTP